MIENDRGESLLSMSLRDLAGKYKDVPFQGPEPKWPPADEETQQWANDLSDWVEERLVDVMRGELDTQEIDGEFMAQMEELSESAESGHQWLEYLGLMLRGKIWQAEAIYWQALIVDEVKKEEDSPVIWEYASSMRYPLLMSTKFFMAAEIKAGFRLENIHNAVVANLRYLDLDKEAEAIENSSVAKGEHGRKNAKWN